MATLLLVFFVFLFSVSEVREEDFRAAAGSLRAQIGVRPRRGSTVASRVPLDVRRRERQRKERTGLPGRATKVRAAATGPRVVVGGSISFARGSADITGEQKTALREIADELRGLPNLVEVRGHAARGESCAAPDHEDDLALSLARAANVLRFLMTDGGLRRSRRRAAGGGAEEPGLHREEPDRMGRVEIVVLREISRENERVR